MRRTSTLAAAVATLALTAGPAFAVPSPTNEHAKGTPPAHAGKPASPVAPAQTPGPGASASAKAKGKAYGKYCQGQSKQHVKGEKGTAFSRCVTAMAKLAKQERKAAKEERKAAKRACKTLSKKHVKGEKGTPYSRCIVAAAKLKRDQKAQPAPAS